jgi:cytochrome c biogenesis protein CcdA
MFCEEEIAMVLAERQTPNHILHLLLSVFTAGFWIPVWILVILFGSGAYRCPRCGAKTLGYVPKKYKAALAAKPIPST